MKIFVLLLLVALGSSRSCKKGYKVGRVSGEGYSCVRVAQQIQEVEAERLDEVEEVDDAGVNGVENMEEVDDVENIEDADDVENIEDADDVEALLEELAVMEEEDAIKSEGGVQNMLAEEAEESLDIEGIQGQLERIEEGQAAEMALLQQLVQPDNISSSHVEETVSRIGLNKKCSVKYIHDPYTYHVISCEAKSAVTMVGVTNEGYLKWKCCWI